jgi:hypothetical protein
LGSKGQHATSRPPKPLWVTFVFTLALKVPGRKVRYLLLSSEELKKAYVCIRTHLRILWHGALCRTGTNSVCIFAFMFCCVILRMHFYINLSLFVYLCL